MNEENLARQAELALDRQGDYDSLFYEGQWHSSGSLADRAAATRLRPCVTFWLRLSECDLFTDYFSQPAACLQIIPFSEPMSDLRDVSARGLLALYPESMS